MKQNQVAKSFQDIYHPGMFSFLKFLFRLPTNLRHIMAILEDINSTLEANEALLTNLQEDQVKLVTLVTTLVEKVKNGGVISLSDAQAVLASVQGQNTKLEQLNVTQDEALAAGADPVPVPTPERGRR